MISSRLSLSTLAVVLAARAFAAESVAGGSAAPAGYRMEVCQVAVLRNGFTVEYVRREVAGLSTRLWLPADAGAGYLEVPSEQIDGFEQRQNAVPLPPAIVPEPAPAVAPEPAAKDTLPVKESIGNLIANAASRYRIDADFVASVVKAESAFKPAAVSPKGARGLMQLMPQTAATLGVEDALDPAANVEGGTKYLRQLLDQYNGDAVKALAAYNAGPQRVEQYGGIPPYRETRAYITRIIDDFNRKKLQQRAQSTAAPTGK